MFTLACAIAAAGLTLAAIIMSQPATSPTAPSRSDPVTAASTPSDARTAKTCIAEADFQRLRRTTQMKVRPGCKRKP
jgi:hypothetical protein